MRLKQIAGLSDSGRVRRRNEDAFVCAPPLFAVADGMGGAQAGEIASNLAASALQEYQPPDELAPEARLRSLIQEANRRIYSRAASDPRASGMGTTMTAALVTGDQIAVGHVGDSRAYRIRAGVIEQLTEDHSLVADLVRSGRLSPEEAEGHPQRSVITRALGTDAAVAIDSFTVEAHDGDVYLLCSDGLTTMVGEETLLHLVGEAPDLGAAARQLIAAANRGGGEDNVTVVLFALEEGDPTDEDTFSNLELPIPPAVPVAGEEAVAAPRRSRRDAGRPRSRASRVFLLVALALVVFAGLAGLALWGLSRAHFVGADSAGRVTVYQGVPWNAFGSLDLYREIYVSQLLAVQLSPEERTELFDHSLVSEAEARRRITPYEQEAQP